MARARGFTLIEVLIALLIMSVLASLAWPSYAGYLAKTRRMEGKLALITAMQQQEQHHAVHHTYVAFSSAAPVDGLRWWSGNAALTSAYELDAEACPDRELRDCVQLRARPGTSLVDVRFVDAECGTLLLRSTGEQGASGPSTRCWP